MTSHFHEALQQLLEDRYKGRGGLDDPYELVKAFCIDGGAKACHEQEIPSVERKKEQMKKNVKNDL